MGLAMKVRHWMEFRMDMAQSIMNLGKNILVSLGMGLSMGMDHIHMEMVVSIREISMKGSLKGKEPWLGPMAINIVGDFVGIRLMGWDDTIVKRTIVHMRVNTWMVLSMEKEW